jgi:hypothetical protein
MEEADCHRRLMDMFSHPHLRQEIARAREAELAKHLGQVQHLIRQARGGETTPELDRSRAHRRRRRWAVLVHRPIAT